MARRKNKYKKKIKDDQVKKMTITVPNLFNFQTPKFLNPPSPSVPPWFHEELKKIGGVADNGQPLYRIVWGPDQKVFAYGEYRLKYLQSSRRVPVAWEVIQDGEAILLPVESANDPKYPIGRLVFAWLDVGKPFFYLEEWCPPEIACTEWELIRWEVDPNKYHDDPDRMIDVLGPAPNQGLYRPVLSLQDNDGNPLYPNESTLEWVRRTIKIKENHPKLKQGNWRDKPAPAVIEGYIRQKYQELYEAEYTYEEHLVDVYTEAMKPHQHRFNGVTNPGNGHILIR